LHFFLTQPTTVSMVHRRLPKGTQGRLAVSRSKARSAAASPLHELVFGRTLLGGFAPVLEVARSSHTLSWPQVSAGLCLHHLFEHQVELAPEALAVVCEGRHWTYRELNQRANCLARQLRRRGVGHNVLVGLCVERSLEMVAGILGILKAGGAYVPLDPAYPRRRLALMLEEAQVPVLVTQNHLTGRLPSHRAELVDVGANSPSAACRRRGQETSAERRRVQDAGTGDLAYVIFTSGSTGRPKGVMVRHRNVVSLFEAMQPYYRFHAGDVWTLFHSYAFDFSVWELWGALLFGGRLVVVPYAVSRSPQAFYELLRRERVTVLNQTPSAFRQLIQVEEVNPSGLPLAPEKGSDPLKPRGRTPFPGQSAILPRGEELALRLVIFGGEALALPALRPWFERHGDQIPQLVNMYGITETTIHVTYRPIRRVDLDSAPGSVIGRPMPGWQIELLDENRQPVLDGEAGEIYVGGNGVAAGYLHRPELTAEGFVPDPFSGNPEARLYKSGDLARRLPDGDLVYLGRLDHQVKIRGFRVELLEIEAVLARHPAIREAAVLARKDTPDAQRLVAYVSARQGSVSSAGELRSFVRDRLPDYMIPAAFVFLEQLPMTAHGKVNRDLLPPLAANQTECRTDCPSLLPFIAPRDECQRRLQRIWTRLLRVRPVGVRDNFFELGGDSLLLMNLCLEINKTFGRDVPLPALLREPTIERLARLLAHETITDWSAVVPLQPHGTKPPFFCVHPLGGQVLGYRLLAGYLGLDQPFYGLQGLPLDCPTEPWASLDERAAAYLADMLRVQPEGPYYLGGYSLGAFVAFEMACQLHYQGRRVAFLGILDDGPALVQDPREWNAQEMLRFLGNVPFWLSHQLLHKEPNVFLRDLGRKVRVWKRKLCNRTPGRVDVEEALDVSPYSASYRRRLADSYGILKSYVPPRYPGRITLFRARTQPLLSSHRPDLGWGARAAGGVQVFVVPGDHNSIVVEPDVRTLATALAGALERNRPEPARCAA
jgi:non-ribosomal peptide synthetase component F/thioesterase domain-containing protein